MSTLLQDLRFALRNLRRTPAFPLAAIATLAIGIGATTAIFSTVNAALLKPLPYPAPQDLYSVRTFLTDGRVTTGLVSALELSRLNDPSLSVVRAAGLQSNDVTLLRNDGAPLKTHAYGVTQGFFDLFGLPMTFGGTSDQVPPRNGPPAGVVISYRIWRDLYGSDPAVVGKPIRFAEISTTVAGVAPRDFDTPHGADFWVTFPFDPQQVAHVYEVYMRVKPGTTLPRIRSELTGVMAGVARDSPVSASGRIYVTKPLVDSIVGDLGPILIIVLSATGLLLALACVNVTNLLLARGAARAREMAVRVSLGASRGRIVRQLLTESIVLATAGAVVGVGAAYGFVRLLLAVGASQLPRLDQVAFDGSVLSFALITLVASGLIVGFAPALRLAATDVKTLINESGRSTSGGRATARWLGAMTIAEVALAIVLVAGAGWLIRDFGRLRNTDPGFVADGRLVFDVTLQGPNFGNQAAVLAGFNDLHERLRALAGVTGVGSTTNFPLRPGPENALYVHIDGDPNDAAHNYNTRQRLASPGYFGAMGIKFFAGRDFTVDDKQGAPGVAIVNRSFVRKYLNGRDPLTSRFTSGYPEIDPRNQLAIVGVVDDVRHKSLNEPAEPAYYNTTTQGAPRRQTIVVHSATKPTTALQTAIRDELRKVDPQMAVDIDSATTIVEGTLSRQSLGMTLMMWFGAAAVALAAVGVYGVIAYGAAQRRGEVATRLALGATPGDVFWLVLKQGRTLAIVGAAIGVTVAYLSGRLVSSRLYDVQASDPIVLAGATLFVLAMALVATTVPAIRASRLKPSAVLRPD
ncbi:MAG TPA: ABC transporter permease [Vicinamibacterales bacterium]|nr:ABC transporter permease [Vicinamibacterales bacterium]